MKQIDLCTLCMQLDCPLHATLWYMQELSLVKHPHVVEFKGAFLTPRYLAFIMEYVEGETIEVGVPATVLNACMQALWTVWAK